MKKIYLLGFAIVLASASLHAQINKGAILLGGSIGVSNGRTEDPSFTSKDKRLYVLPVIGIATRQNTVIGINVGYSRSRTESASGQSSNIYDDARWSAGLFYRRYFPLSGKLYAFAQGNVNYTNTKQEQTNLPGTNNYMLSKTNTYSLSLAPGFAYAVSQSFQLELGFNSLASLGYSHGTRNTGASSTPSDKQKFNGFNFETNASLFSQLTVGFRVLLNK